MCTLSEICYYNRYIKCRITYNTICWINKSNRRAKQYDSFFNTAMIYSVVVFGVFFLFSYRSYLYSLRMFFFFKEARFCCSKLMRVHNFHNFLWLYDQKKWNCNNQKLRPRGFKIIGNLLLITSYSIQFMTSWLK